MSEQFNLKQIKYKNINGRLEVTLRDQFKTPIYKGDARLNDKKDVFRLMGELKHKGLNFPKTWLKCNALDKIKRKDEERD